MPETTTTDAVEKKTPGVNKANVSTTRGIKGGYLFAAPVGTNLPTDIKTELDPAFFSLGYVSSDGFEESVDQSSGEINDMNGDLVDTYDESAKETIVFKLIEQAKNPLSVQYGTQNVATRDGMIVVDHNWSKAGESLSFIFELVLKNGRRWRKVIPEGRVTERGSFTGSSTEVAGRECTVSYLTDENGSGCKDYIEDIDNPVKQPTEGTEDPVQEQSLPAGEDLTPEKPLDDMTLDELKTYAREHSIDITGKTLKDDILTAIKAAEAENGGE